MLFWTIVKVSFRSLWGAKLRSFLAILGIIMGVAAVISMMSIVEGAKRQIDRLIGRLGTDILFVWPEYRSVNGKGAYPKLTLDDAWAILQKSDAVVRVSPQVSAGGNIKVGSKTVQGSVGGIAPSYFVMEHMEVESGRAFSATEVERAAAVIVIGPKTAQKFFGAASPLGREVKINQHVFRVIGVLKARGSQAMGNEDDRIFAPFTTVLRQLSGRQGSAGQITVQATSAAAMNAAEAQIHNVLRQRHHIKADEKEDFGVYNQAGFIEAQQKTINIFSIVLGGIGGICLLTGGIGIMNIMLVIVTERTREIGLRKAIGAKNRDILTQFLLESVLMSGLGGVMGIAAGWALAYLITKITPLKTEVSPQSILLALACAAGVGIFFGFYPATRAARLSPIDALHTE